MARLKARKSVWRILTTLMLIDFSIDVKSDLSNRYFIRHLKNDVLFIINPDEIRPLLCLPGRIVCLRRRSELSRPGYIKRHSTLIVNICVCACIYGHSLACRGRVT